MELTRHNFEEELEGILEAIKESTYIAFDTEFTGLKTGENNQPAPYDLPADRYHKLRKGASDFLLLQFGLCTFKADPDKQRYEAKPYNFYIFPRPLNRQAPDRVFLCQSSSIDFLVTHNFDFNKVFKEGIPFLSQEQEMKMKANLEQKHMDLNNQSFSRLFSPDGGQKKSQPVPVPEEHKPFIDDISEKVTSYLNEDHDNPLVLPPCNAFLRKLIYQTLECKCPQALIETKTGEKKERYIMVRKAKDENELQLLAFEKQRMEMMELDIQVGFTKVMRAVSESGKLLIGHNMYLDVIHSLTHFFGPLPDQLDDFKNFTHSVFPRLVDTKLMANTNPYKEHFLGTSLEDLKCSLKTPPFKPAHIDLVEGFEKYKDGEAFHEAGYDAFITGSCFASLLNFLGGYQNPASLFVLPSQPCLEPFVNKLFMMRIIDIPYLNLTGADVIPERDHIFHVTFPSEWKHNDLYQLFQPYGNIRISWLSESTAFVEMINKENVMFALSGLQSDSSVYRVITFSAFTAEKNAREANVQGTPTHCSNSTHQVVGIKRKSPNMDLGFPKAKIERRSITKDVKLQSPILEVEENSDSPPKTPFQDKAAEGKTEAPVLKEKLFEESDQW